MANKINSDNENLHPKLIGEILLEADLISPAQLKVALADQHSLFMLKLGEILAVRGWLKQETVDFLVEKVINHQQDSSQNSDKRIGQYFQQAGLLTNEQVDLVLQEQKKLGTKFGYIAVLKGFLKQKTLTFFLEKVLEKSEIETFRQISTYREEHTDQETLIDSTQDIATNSASIDELDSHATKLPGDCEGKETLILKSDAEEEMTEEIVITTRETIKISSQETKFVYNGEIAYSTIWIDT